MNWMKHAMSGAIVAAVAVAAPAAFADTKTETFVEKNANAVLQVLNDNSLTPDQRAKTFAGYMNKFAHMPSIAQRVLGPKARELTEDQRQRYFKAFEDYALAVYQYRLDQFRGEAIKVTASENEGPRRYLVTTEIKSADTGQQTRVVWDVLESQDGASYRVRDVALDIKGNQIWLAQDQARDFQTILDRNHGDIDKLIDEINRMTTELKSGQKLEGE
ncbi:MAG: ABC transporter substrate-binding protein [Hyphomonadaceae bacterium]